MSDFTKEEMSAIRSVRRAFKKIPNTIKMYSMDGGLVACKEGVPSDEAFESILIGGIYTGCMLTDMHDDENNGEYTDSVRTS